MPQDQYTPPAPDAAVCPYCQHVVTEVPQPPPWAELLVYRACCPQCGGHWHELRLPGEVNRYTNYTAAEGAHPGCRGAYLREEAPRP
jgi:hypothetical protein